MLKIIGFFSGLINGLLGTGGGIILVTATKIMGVKPKIAHATALTVILPLSLVSIIMYFKNGQLEVLPAVLISAGGGVGGFLGAKLLKKTPDKWLKILFGITTIVLGVMMFRR
ncbi:MAG: sulfite exporter TauE/SafE family protein [Clostridia bacterium]|nr:sulfite exporter TauE/SafE family protein [Clostridia bacterium]MBQ4543641.1 sulfite exporter TauE/SafE family protein [Clostridia bacterium]MBQ9997923.1 sulfite exporter TauE/SafE family protein [Clostridia bacterium]